MNSSSRSSFGRDSARGPLHRIAGAAALGLFAAILSMGCLGGDDPSGTPTLAPASPPRAVSIAPTRLPGTSTPAISPTPSATPPPAVVTPTDGPGAAAAIAAAEQALGAVHLDQLARDACEKANPPRGICISLQSTPAEAASGVARFVAGSLDGGGFRFYMGRSLAGQWGFWFGTQQQSDVVDVLPGALLSCGDAVPVYAEPNAMSSATGSLARQVALQAGGFVLASPGTFGADGGRGQGWYYISAPLVGWVSAANVTSAEYGDCLLHDDLWAGARG